MKGWGLAWKNRGESAPARRMGWIYFFEPQEKLIASAPRANGFGFSPDDRAGKNDPPGDGKEAPRGHARGFRTQAFASTAGGLAHIHNRTISTSHANSIRQLFAGFDRAIVNKQNKIPCATSGENSFGVTRADFSHSFIA